jgi:peptidylprolyl isomerase
MKRVSSAILVFVTLLVCSLALIGCGKQPESATATPSSATPQATTEPSATGSPAVSPQNSSGELKTTPSGLQYQDLVVGTGPKPFFGQTVRITYTGWLKDGKQFDSNADKAPLNYKLAFDGDFIKGWTLGIGGSAKDELPAMRVGGKRKLIIPPALGYGDRDLGKIPPNSTLVFEVELVGIRSSAGFGM